VWESGRRKGELKGSERDERRGKEKGERREECRWGCKRLGNDFHTLMYN
jgi:hypothetical protein